MLGGIAGDIIGSVYEKRNYKAKGFDPLFHPQARFTDDTVCLVAVADAVTRGLDPVKALQDWGRRYWDNGGWGQRFLLWLGDDQPQPYNSWGNGGAMRVGPAAFLAASLEDAIHQAHVITAVTHNHPEGIKGAQATAASIWLALQGVSPEVIRDCIVERFGYDLHTSVDAIRPAYRHSEAAHLTVPQALVCALEAKDFEDAVRNAVSIGGDSDTIASIAGAVAEARFGLPMEITKVTWNYLPFDMRQVVRALYRGNSFVSSLLDTL